MTIDLEKKLLAEAFDALVNDNDIAKATRLFKRQWDLKARNCYSLLESEDEDFEISDMGDDFNAEVSDEMGDEFDEKFDQLLVAIDELEDKFPGEMSDEVQGRFDELRNLVDEMRFAEGDESENSVDDAMVVVEDLRSDFEVAGEVSDEVNDLFDEISSKLQGDSAEDVEEIDVEDDDSEFDADADAEEPVEESEDLEAELVADNNMENEDVESEEPSLDADAEEPAEESDPAELIADAEDNAEDLLKALDKLSDEFDADDAIEEGWSNIADPRKKMTSEEEGVNKKGTMNFGKLRGLSLDKKAGLGTKESDSKGTSADKKPRVQATDNKGAKQWHKIEKPANKPNAGKSMMGN